MALKLEREERTFPSALFNRSARFDLVFKASLAKAWANGTAKEISRACQAYLEMIRARTWYGEEVPPRNSPASFISDFKKTASSILKNGYSPDAEAIPVDLTLELVNGAHRLSCCLAFGMECRIGVYSQYHYCAGGSVYDTFRIGLIDRAVENFGVRRYFEFNDRARIAVEKAPVFLRKRFILKRTAEWKKKGAILWHWRFLPGGKVAFVLSFPDGTQSAPPPPSQEEIDSIYPDLPFPDWTARTRKFPWHRLWWMTQNIKYRLLARIHKGHKREKSLFHAGEYLRKMLCFARMARFIAKHPDGITL